MELDLNDISVCVKLMHDWAYKRQDLYYHQLINLYRRAGPGDKARLLKGHAVLCSVIEAFDAPGDCGASLFAKFGLGN